MQEFKSAVLDWSLGGLEQLTLFFVITEVIKHSSLKLSDSAVLFFANNSS